MNRLINQTKQIQLITNN